MMAQTGQRIRSSLKLATISLRLTLGKLQAIYVKKKEKVKNKTHSPSRAVYLPFGVTEANQGNIKKGHNIQSLITNNTNT